MNLNYIWKIDQLTAYPIYESQTDVIFKVTWSYHGINSDGIGSSRGGITEIFYDPDAPFTPFSQLTEAQVLSWIQPTITSDQMAKMKAEINEDISWLIAQANSNDPISPQLPWSVSASAKVK